ncbi:MAG: hypothetical protein AAF945_21460 [Actinomycetota bacterium]
MSDVSGETPRQGRGWGKVILFGEHSVVYGRSAIAATMDRGVVARAEDAGERDVLAIRPWDVRITLGDATHPDLEQAFSAALAVTGAGAPIACDA